MPQMADGIPTQWQPSSFYWRCCDSLPGNHGAKDFELLPNLILGFDNSHRITKSQGSGKKKL